MNITVREANREIEKRIIKGLLTNEEIIMLLLDQIDIDLIENKSAKIILSWIIENSKTFGSTPLGIEGVENKFLVERRNLNPEKANVLSKYLENISSLAAPTNPSLFTKEALSYLESQFLQQTLHTSSALLKAGRVGPAKEALSKFSSNQKQLALSSSFNPFNKSEIEKFFDLEEAGFNFLFKLEGFLGEMLHPIEREGFYSITAPEKGKKSHFLQEITFQAVENEQKVLFLSHEMHKNLIQRRIYRRATGFGTIEETITHPIFDCEKNQDGSCDLPQRENEIRLITERGTKPRFDPLSDYRVCTACRGESEFKPTYWFKQIFLNKYEREDVLKSSEAIQRIFGDNLRIITYPKYSATFSDIQRDMDVLARQGFNPDVVIDDMLDIHGKEHDNERTNIDIIWKTAARIAGERKLAYFTGEQAKAIARDKPTMDQNDAWSNSKEKDGHIYGKFGINATKAEWRDNVCRISHLYQREGKIKSFQVMCLMCLEIAEVCLDTERVFNQS